jgi:glycosyltransferase involved in cell wall biosynthesis
LTRILIALTYYYPHWTGLTANAQNLAEGLARRGHTVTVLTSRYRRDLPREERHRGVHIVREPSWLRLSRGQVMPGFAGAVWRLLREHDLALVFTPMLETWLVGALAHRAGKPMVMAHQGDLVMPRGAWNQMVQRGMNWLLERGARIADRITILNRDYAEHSAYLRPHLDKVAAIYPPMDIPRPRPEAVRAWRRELGLEGRPVVGFAGRWVEEKGFDYLLQAMPLVAEAIPGVALAFAGETNVAYEAFYERCRPLIEANAGRLHVLGLITDRQRLADYYALCDLFVLPSRTDCFAVVQVEAMLCGTPVVASDIPGAREPVRATGMGLCVPSGDPRALAEGIVQVLRERERYCRPCAEIAAVFDPEETISAYERLFDELLAGGGAGRG